MKRSDQVENSEGASQSTICLVAVFLVQIVFCSAFNIAPKSNYIVSKPGYKYSEKSAYFGYSVGILNNNRSIWLLVGAPRANSTNGHSMEPGAFFKCPLDLENPLTECEEVILDRNHPRGNHSWAGASMDIDQNGNVVVCAPRWKNDKYHYYNEYMVSGMCYLIGPELDERVVTFIMPMLDREKQTYNYFNKGVYYYAHGQCGFDIHFTKNKQMLIGFPGVMNWQGSVGKFNQLEVMKGIHARRIEYTKDLIPNPIHTQQIIDTNYFGYSLTSGTFRRINDIFYVAGAPRGGKSNGMVLVFLMKMFESQPLYIQELKWGTQMGEYFGASVAAPDLNGDGLSDLVVGAPMHSVEGSFDAGCIYVYINVDEEKGKLPKKGLMLTGDIENQARFGTSLGTPGDLNMDGFEDLLVGAPYENENSGAVYVFMGSENGIREKYSQKLVPEEVSRNTQLKGFGISFSRPNDVDGNQYPDFAIGSFLSDEVSVMQTRPVIKLSGTMSSKPTKLSLTDEAFNLTSCVTYQGLGTPSSIDIAVKLSIRQESESGVFLANFRDSGTTELVLNFINYERENNCRTTYVGLSLERSNAQNPLIVSMDLHLTDEENKEPYNPIMSPFVEAPSNLVLSFVTGCQREICHSDLVISAAIKGIKSDDKMLIGLVPKVTLEVEVLNKNEPAFLPNVTIIVPAPLVVLPSLQECTVDAELNHTTIICQLENPLKKNEKDFLSFDLDVVKLNDHSADIEIDIEAQSAAEVELNPHDNKFKLVTEVEKRVFMKVTGWSRPEQYNYDLSNKGQIRTNQTLKIQHLFSVEKSDITPVRDVIIEVAVPRSLWLPRKRRELLLYEKLYQELTLHGNSHTCEVILEEELGSRRNFGRNNFPSAVKRRKAKKTRKTQLFGLLIQSH